MPKKLKVKAVIDCSEFVDMPEYVWELFVGEMQAKGLVVAKLSSVGFPGCLMVLEPITPAKSK